MDSEKTIVSNPTNDCKPKKQIGLVVFAVIMTILAVGGIGFGVYEYFETKHSNQYTSELESRIDELSEKIAVVSKNATTEDIAENQSDGESGLVVTALNEEKTVAWPEDVQRSADDPESLTNKVAIPKINLDTETVKQINQKIYDAYSGYLNGENCKGPCSVDVSYDYIERDGVLYLVIGTDVHSYRATGGSRTEVYYYDIVNDKELSMQDIKNKYDIAVSDESLQTIVPSVLNSFDYYYRDELNCNNAPRMGCVFINNTR